MYKDILQQIDSVEIWPIISLSIFFFFFLTLLGWALTAEKAYIQRMKQLPFDEAKAGGNENDDINQ
jgi:cytochrome c oxidase cbb3-type subunit 4